MSKLKHNLAANYLGQGWSVIMGLAFIPLYIRYLGMEAYGLVGLFAVIQTSLSLLDMGMTPTLNREMARYTAGAHSVQSIHNLLCSVTILCVSLAVFIAFGIWFASDYLASGWLRTEKLSAEVIAPALSMMGLVIALRFVESIYRSSLIGLQHQIWYSWANAILLTVRHAGAAAILSLLSPTINTFFLWQAFVSLLSVLVFAASVYSALPLPPLPPRFSREAIAGIQKFAGSMFWITLLSILLTQVDRVILSRMLTLEAFGYYSLAATVAGSLYMLVAPITQAVYPRMAELVSRDDQNALMSVYHQSAQMVTVSIGPLTVILFTFGDGVLFLWSGNIDLVVNTNYLLSVLVLGTFLHGLMWIPYHLQLSYGWTSLSIKSNLVAVISLIPAMFWIVPHYGAIGAAWIWVTLNAGYVVISIQFMHRRLIMGQKWRWYVSDVLLPVFGAASIVLIAQRFKPVGYLDRWEWLYFLFFIWLFAQMASLLMADKLRPRFFAAGKYFFRYY